MIVDLTGVVTAAVGGVFSVLGIVATYLINSRVSNAAAAETLDRAVSNSLGAIEQAATSTVTAVKPSIALPPGVSPQLAVGVQYVVDHAGPEMTRLGITPQAVASKIDARLGLAKIAVQAAQAAAPGSSTTVTVTPSPPPAPAATPAPATT